MTVYRLRILLANVVSTQILKYFIDNKLHNENLLIIGGFDFPTGRITELLKAVGVYHNFSSFA